MAEFVLQDNYFKSDLKVNHGYTLVIAPGDTDAIKKQFSSAAWLDGFNA